MGRKKRLMVADLAQEAGMTESEAIERLRRNGMEAYEGFRISAGNMRRARVILSNGNRVADVQNGHDSIIEASDENATKVQSSEARVRLKDVVDDWFSKNSEPKHIAVGGRTYDDFARNCYQYLLAHALRRGVPATDILIGAEDYQQIEAFLNRAKALWDRRRCEELRKAEELRQAEEHQKAEEQRQAREHERQRLAVVLRRPKDAWHQQQSGRKAEDANGHEELIRIGQIMTRYRRALEDESFRLQMGQCTSVDYYAFALRNRVRRSAEILFGSAEQPNYEILKKNPKLLEELKELSFGDDRHPGNYQNPYASAYYTLRYEVGYAFEYSQVYGLLLAIMRQEEETSPFDVISIGSGQGLDYWGLRYALSKQGQDQLSVGWHGIDLEEWPDHILDDGIAQYSDGVDIRDVLGGMSRLDAKVLMFPKVISELSGEALSFITSWLERVTFTRDVHYLCFVHTERNSLNPSVSKHKGADDCFLYPNDSSLDAVKSAALISAARNGAGRQFYSFESEWRDSSSTLIDHYDVVWPDSRAGKDWRGTYSYLDYGEKNVPVWEYDHTFEMSKTLRDAIKDIGYSCCSEFISSGEDRNCDINHVSCNDSYRCPLHRYPRFRTGRIAYQIVRLVYDIPF